MLAQTVTALLILDKDPSALVSREGTFKPIVVVEGHAFMQLHVNKPRGPGMTLVLWIRESLIQLAYRR